MKPRPKKTANQSGDEVASRKRLATYGPKGRTVRVFRERGALLVRVQWTNALGLVETRSWNNTSSNVVEAKAYAKAFSEAREMPNYSKPTDISIRILWDRYVTAEFDSLRPKTQKNYARQWRTWELFAGRSLEADLVTPELLDDLRADLSKRRKANGEPAPVAISQQRHIVSTVKRVFAWGIQRGLVSRERILLYRFKISKAQRAELVPEYSNAEHAAIVRRLNPLFRNQWRAWALTVIAGEVGPRINAALHLRWADVDLPYESTTNYYGAITWRAEFDKLGNVRVQPITEAVREALFVALGYAHLNLRATGQGVDWLFYTPATKAELKGDGTYSVQAAWSALQRAEKEAGVTHRVRRAFHGGRRMAAGNALDLTNNPVLAMQWIGDTDLKQARKYLKEREDPMRDVASRMRAARVPVNPQISAEGPVSNPNATATQPETKTAPEKAGAVSDVTTRTYE